MEPRSIQKSARNNAERVVMILAGYWNGPIEGPVSEDHRGRRQPGLASPAVTDLLCLLKDAVR